jgi:hypothetical protein
LASSFSGGADAVSALQAGGGGQGAVLLFLLTLVGKRSALIKWCFRHSTGRNVRNAENNPLRESHELLTDLSGRLTLMPSTGCVMAIGAVFDDVSTKVLGDAFDAVLAMLHGAQYPDRVREAIADRVLEFARNTTERDPQRLAGAVVASLGIKL